MLQQPSSHLTSVCGHSHFKKVWLWQTQRENQACEDRKGHSDGKHNQLSPGDSPSRTSAQATPLPVRSLVACGSYDVSTSRPRRTSLVTCVESLTSAHLPKSPYRPSSPSSGSPNLHVQDQALSDDANISFKSASISCSPCASQSYSVGVTLGDQVPSDQGESIKQILSGGNQSLSYSSDHDESSAREDLQTDALNQKFQRGQRVPGDRVEIFGFSSDASDMEDSTGSKKFAGPGGRRNGSMLQGFHKFDLKLNQKESIHALQSVNEELVDLSGSVFRACSTCGTTKTPLWRTGPHGPKSLCNACGIRYKKAKRSAQGEASPLASPGNAKLTGRFLKRKQDMMIGSGLGWSRGSNSEIPKPEKQSSWANSRLKINTSGDYIDRVSPFTLVQDSYPIWGSASTTYIRSAIGNSFEKHLVNSTTVKDEEDAASLLMYLSSKVALR